MLEGLTGRLIRDFFKSDIYLLLVGQKRMILVPVFGLQN